jgi:predicted amidohydrolase
MGHSGELSTPSRNLVTVLKRGRQIAWQQAKLFSYDLTNATVSRDHLPLRSLPDPGFYTECLDLPTGEPRVVTVADTVFGRFMVAICEDSAKIAPILATVVQARVTHLVIPIMDRELDQHGWYMDFVRPLSRTNQCVSIVCTSGFYERHCRYHGLPRRLGEKVRSDDHELAVLLIHAPPWDRSPTVMSWGPSSGIDWVMGACPKA